MDHFINILVKIFVFFSRFAPVLGKLGLVKYRSFDSRKKGTKLHILLVGYNGARNTGSDIRVVEIARQLKDRLGKDHVEISVMTMDVEAMRGYFDADVRLIHCSSIFLWAVFKACCASQAVILCEGSTLKSKFADALTLYSCEAAGIAKNQHKPCIAYGSEAGDMDPWLERTVKKLCKDTYFIARTGQSLDHIHRLGFHGHLGTDAAWEFDSSSYAAWARAQLKASGWDGKAPLLGIAPINPFWWPVRPSLFKWLKAGITGDHALQFRLWYFFSWNDHRERQFDAYLDALAGSVNAFAAEHACHVVILGMEQLDTDACHRLKAKLNVPASTFLSADHNGYEMAAVLRQLSLLVTSRYHAEVLSMEDAVPTVAVSMDERLDNLMQEMGLDGHLLFRADDPDLASKLSDALSYTWSHQAQLRAQLGAWLKQDQDTLDEMGNFLAKWLRSPENVV